MQRCHGKPKSGRSLAAPRPVEGTKYHTFLGFFLLLHNSTFVCLQYWNLWDLGFLLKEALEIILTMGHCQFFCRAEKQLPKHQKPFKIRFLQRLPIGTCRVWMPSAQAARQAKEFRRDLKAWPQHWDPRWNLGGRTVVRFGNPREELPDIKKKEALLKSHCKN